MIVCLLVEGWEEAAGVAALLEVVPRIAVGEGGAVWLDARGLDLEARHAAAVSRLESLGSGSLRAGAASVPVVAWLAAQESTTGQLRTVPAADAAAFLAPLPLARLGVDARTLALLDGVGVGTCGALASLPRETVEVRFGGAAVRWWRLARGEDERRLFAPIPPEAPHASLDFIDYVVTDPERLLFTANALLGTVCDRLLEQGAHARRMQLVLTLGNGTRWERELRPARPTASRSTWLRLVRTLLERLTVPDAVAGMAVRVVGAEAAGAVQGDLFDAGFATAAAVESAVARLLEEQGAVVVRPAASAHPLVEQRLTLEPVPLHEATAASGLVAGTDAPPAAPALTLQLLPQPRPVLVETVQRRDHEVPVRYRDGRWHPLINAAGPDRVSGGQWEQSYAREYFRAVTAEGTLVWLFRDACRDRWYLHGWWD